MTHARTPTLNHPETAEQVRSLRSLADRGGLPLSCPHRACRRSKSCRGPVGPARYRSEADLPACLARALDEIYGPVAEWEAFLDRMYAMEDKLHAAGFLPDRAPSGDDDSARREEIAQRLMRRYGAQKSTPTG